MDIEFCVDIFVSALKKVPPWFLMRNLLLFKLLFPYRQGIIFSSYFQHFFFISQTFNYDASWHGFFFFNLLTAQLFVFLRLCLLPNWGKFRPFIFSTFVVPSFFSSALRSLMTE